MSSINAADNEWAAGKIFEELEESRERRSYHNKILTFSH